MTKHAKQDEFVADDGQGGGGVIALLSGAVAGYLVALLLAFVVAPALGVSVLWLHVAIVVGVGCMALGYGAIGLATDIIRSRNF